MVGKKKNDIMLYGQKEKGGKNVWKEFNKERERERKIVVLIR